MSTDLVFRHPTYTDPDAPVVPRSPRAAEVAAVIGVDADSVCRRARRRERRLARRARAPRPAPPRPTDPELRALLPDAGQVLLITGPSGGGKSSLLRELLRVAQDASAQPARPTIDLTRIGVPDDAHVVDCFGDSAALDEVLSRLSRVGLAEVWTFLRTPAELSDGQRWRLRLAIALHQVAGAPSGLATSPAILACDEFGAILDRVTACVVARALRRVIDSADVRERAGAIVATSHDDLTRALQPDVVALCDFGRVVLRRLARPASS